MNEIDEWILPELIENAFESMLVTSVVRHTLERVWSPGDAVTYIYYRYHTRLLLRKKTSISTDSAAAIDRPSKNRSISN
jgi:hypothetical protein